MPDNILDITPDPKVLIALTHTPLKPLDALCELVDNGIDSFRAAALRGIHIPHPFLEVLVPGEAETRRGEGSVRVVDNGAGLDQEGLANALRAGFSGKNRYDTLGLFGMGFNIATGKLGRITTVTTARPEDDHALRVVIDLPHVVRSQRFEVPVEEVPKPLNFENGTIIEVTSWWPDGQPNAGFVTQLAHVPKTQLRGLLGRRYATILRSEQEGRIRIALNGEPVRGFEHCVWSAERFVERQGWGLIHAQATVDEVIHAQRRCVNDGTVMEGATTTCVECGGAESRTVEERLRGWVGIQRFDDNNKFGIDLIRNGRAIRVAEKDAFFNHLDELGEAVKEYPTDQQTGRIVGEVHVDHVPVDFQKQDFQRSTEEWQRAMSFLRGGSLLPSNWEAGQRNETPVSKLFQGFRKVRNPGRPDMYMGRYDEATRKAVRVSRETEADFYRRFQDREPGYYDDARWWDLVESAAVPPVLALEECPACGFQNMPDADTCEDCGHILQPKECLACASTIPASATSCPDCGASQIPEVEEPWRCAVCGETNGIDDESCGTCSALRGAEHPTAPDSLRRDAEALPALSLVARSFTLSDGRTTEPIDVSTFRRGPLRPSWDRDPVPSVVLRAAGRLEIFLDLGHSAFAQLGLRPEEAVATEIAQYLYNMRSELAGRAGHSVLNIASTVLADVWGEHLSAGPDQIRDALRHLFARIAERLEGTADAADFYGELDQFEQRELADRLITEDLLNQLGELRASGAYLRFCGPGVIARFFARKPEPWFGPVWSDNWPDAAVMGSSAAENAREQMVGSYSRCLEDCAAYLRYSSADPDIMGRARASRAYLENHLA